MVVSREQLIVEARHILQTATTNHDLLYFTLPADEYSPLSIGLVQDNAPWRNYAWIDGELKLTEFCQGKWFAFVDYALWTEVKPSAWLLFLNQLVYDPTTGEEYQVAGTPGQIEFPPSGDQVTSDILAQSKDAFVEQYKVINSYIIEEAQSNAVSLDARGIVR